MICLFHFTFGVFCLPFSSEYCKMYWSRQNKIIVEFVQLMLIYISALNGTRICTFPEILSCSATAMSEYYRHIITILYAHGFIAIIIAYALSRTQYVYVPLFLQGHYLNPLSVFFCIQNRFISLILPIY